MTTGLLAALLAMCSATSAWACDSVGTPCADLVHVRATPLPSGTLEPLSDRTWQNAVDEPLVFYVEPSVRAEWEASIELSATLDGQPIEADFVLEDVPPVVRMWIDVPMDAAVLLTTMYLSSAEMQPYPQPVVRVGPTGAMDSETASGLDAEDFGFIPCDVGYWEYVGTMRGSVLARPDVPGLTPVLKPLTFAVPVERSVQDPAECESLLGQAPDLVVQHIDVFGRISDPVVLAYPRSAPPPAPEEDAEPVPTGCSATGLTWSSALVLVPFVMRRRRGRGRGLA